MPVFEFSFILRVLPRNEVAAALKRIGSLLLEKKVVITKLENLGTRDLPYRMTKESKDYHKGSYYVYSFMGNRSIFPGIEDACDLDLDVIRYGFMEAPAPLNLPCTLEKELLPPGERESVKLLMEKSRKLKERTRPLIRHVVKHNYFDVYM